ncbi:MAG: LamG domain-containing protein [Candidatus Marsarchaeota archaeon]|nr:LamG domain-containing protein [Candidatus Marsarchaeota archaeon]
MSKVKRSRAQSAMEYLMTYGWAILIIAVVLAVLYQLGLFSSNFFQPRAQPGSCRVGIVGSGINQQKALLGACLNELPKFVTFVGTSGGLGVAHISIPASALELQDFSVSAWVKHVPDSYGYVGSEYYGVMGFSTENMNSPNWLGWGLYLFNYYGHSTLPNIDVVYAYVENTMQSDTWTPLSISGYPYAKQDLPNTNVWYDVGMTVSSNTITLYVNGTEVASTPYVGPISYNGINPNDGSIGIVSTCGVDCGGGLNGTVADVQFYNTTLSAPEMMAIYDSGIGGDPIDLNHLTGWWPLNGDYSDYSGYNYSNGVAGGTVVAGFPFKNQWISGYYGNT